MFQHNGRRRKRFLNKTLKKDDDESSFNFVKVIRN